MSDTAPMPLSKLHSCRADLQHVHLRTLTRWHKVGVNGHKLVGQRVGGRVMVSHAALNDFLARLNATSETTGPRSPTERSTASAAAASALESVGA